MHLIKKPVIRELQELLNYIAVLDEEYSLPSEIVQALKQRASRVSQRLDEMQRKPRVLYSPWAELEDEDSWL